MKKAMSIILGILFFGSVWGISEVFVGEALYRTGFGYASVPLTVIALVVLSLAKAHLPQAGVSLAVGCCAAGYKCLAMFSAIAETPIYTCHLLGIFLLGATYEIVFSLLPRRNKALCAVAATYGSYVLFALLITYVFRYQPWAAGGPAKVLRHILISGTLAAGGGAILVPPTFRLAEAIGRKTVRPALLRPQLATVGLCLVTATLWAAAILLAV
ncbi:MAG: hypothetical protein SVT52_07160 [Planctomycetota bacterium]|nr:hypothetical protein [Planctomycetota bacterium]